LLSSDTLEQKIIKDIRITGIRHTQEYIIKRELISKVGQVYKEEN
jgi:outer membrane protein assembly factor BamA